MCSPLVGYIRFSNNVQSAHTCPCENVRWAHDVVSRKLQRKFSQWHRFRAPRWRCGKRHVRKDSRNKRFWMNRGRSSSSRLLIGAANRSVRISDMCVCVRVCGHRRAWKTNTQRVTKLDPQKWIIHELFVQVWIELGQHSFVSFQRFIWIYFNVL